MKEHDESGELLGMAYAAGAYAIWGLVPLYWRLMSDLSPVEITLHRVFWAAVFAVLATAARGRFRHLMHIFARRQTLAALALSSVLIAANWTIFIYCVSTNQLVEASLGYYLTPLVSIALGVLVLGERVSPLRWVAIALASCAIGARAMELGHIPWIAPGLALSFGFYGYIRKRTSVDALDGLTVETILLFPVVAAVLGIWAVKGTGAFAAPFPIRDLLLISTGPVTAIPLALFAAGARRIRMTTLGFLQYVSPTITLAIATLLLGEKFGAFDAVAFGCVWIALVLVGFESGMARSAARRAV